MKFNRRTLIHTLVAAASAATLHSAFAAPAKLTVTLDTPAGHFRNVWMDKFAHALKERSGGTLEAEVFPSGQLYSSRDAGKAVARGDVGMAIVATPGLARIEPNLNVLDLPMFSGVKQEQMDQIVDGALGKKLASMVSEKMGVVVPGGWYVLGELNTYATNKPIKSFADLKDMKVRIPGSPAWIASFKQLGANPVSLPFSDVPMALQQGTVDAIVSSNVSINSAKLFDSGIKSAFVNRLGIGYYLPIVSKTYWSTLSAEQQKLFESTWSEFARGQRAAGAQEQAKAREALEAVGVKFIEPDAADLTKAKQTIAQTQDESAAKLRVSAEVIQMAKEALK